MGMIFLTLFGLVALAAVVGSKNSLCYDDYPDLSGLLCYKNCRSGYGGAGPVCWSNCPANTVDIGAVCTKNTYNRGVGTTLRYCPSGKEKSGLICYPTCPSGMSGVGPFCWQRCPSDYHDDGALCRKNAHIYGRNTGSCPWYNKCGLGSNCGRSCNSGYSNDGCTCRRNVHIFAKRTQDRGVGSAMVCGSNEEQSGLLCYPRCRSGYYGVSFLCWASCSGATTDTGTQCQKQTYGRGIGKVINCFTPPKCGSLGGCGPLKSSFSGISSFTAAGCDVLYQRMRPKLALVQTLAGCFRNEEWKTVTISYSAGAAVGVSGGAEVGIGLDANTNKGVCYVGYCYGFVTDVSIGAEINFGFWKSLDSIPGESQMREYGIDIPFTEIGFTVGVVYSSPGNDFIGIVFSIGFGVGLSPIDIGSYNCRTPENALVRFNG